jgi:phosphoglycolate phosphatase-like HAD superfamily hydrolase
MLESLIAGGQAVGLETAVAKRLATQTLYGAAALAAQSEHGPDELRRRVTSPAGTTAAALDVFYAAGWDRTVTHAMAAAKARGQELGRIARGEIVHEPDAAARLDRAIEAARARGKTPVAVLDVDLTLIDNSPRTRAVLAAWLDHLAAAGVTEGSMGIESTEASMGIESTEASMRIEEGAVPFSDEALTRAREQARTMPLAFSIRDNLGRVVEALAAHDRAHHDTLLGEGLRFWRSAFFDPSFLVHDTALDGAAEAVRALTARGVTVVYVTARPGPMATATVESFSRLGFPHASVGTLLWLKTDPKEGDHAFKVRALDACRALGEVVLCAENEPAHANAMHAAFPQALTALIATRHSEPAPDPAPALVRVARLADVVGVGKKSEAHV